MVVAREALGPLLADRSTVVVVAREALGPLLAARWLWPAKPWGHYWQIAALLWPAKPWGHYWQIAAFVVCLFARGAQVAKFFPVITGNPRRAFHCANPS